jgi:hypothetical protein
MGYISYSKDNRTKIVLTPHPECNPLKHQDRQVLMDKTTVEALDDYTRSMPTGPRAGRVYRKNLGWPEDKPDNWFVYFVINAPDGDGQLHVPYTYVEMN